MNTKHLIVALVVVSALAFAVCGEGGGGGGDVGPAALPTQAAMQVGVPLASMGAASILAKINPADVKVTFGGVVMSYRDSSATNAYYAATVGTETASNINSLLTTGAGTLELQVFISGATFTAAVPVSTSGQTGIANIQLTLAFTQDASTGGYTMVVIPGNGTSKPASNDTKPFFLAVSAIKYKFSADTYKDLNGASDVPKTGTVLRVYFNTPTITSATDSFTITASSTAPGGNAYTLTQDDLTSDLLVATTGVIASSAYIEMALNNTTTVTKQFSAGKSYSLTLDTTPAHIPSVTGAYGTATSKIPVGAVISASFTTAL